MESFNIYLSLPTDWEINFYSNIALEIVLNPLLACPIVEYVFLACNKLVAYFYCDKSVELNFCKRDYIYLFLMQLFFS